MELMLEVFDGTGKKVAEADNGGVGDGRDRSQPARSAPGEHYIAVREVWTAGRAATENVSDWYTLTATWKPLVAGHESEPDDVGLGGAADHRRDRPCAVRSAAPTTSTTTTCAATAGGTLAGEVTGVPGVDLRVVVLPAGSTMGPPGPLPPGAKVFDAGGIGAGERIDGVTWAAGTPGPLVVIERKVGYGDAKLGNGDSGKGHAAGPDARHATAGLDVEYALSLRLKP